MNKNITYLHIRAISPSCSRGFILVNGHRFACLLGKAGRTPFKREGDGKSPVGTWRLLEGFYRPDKMRHFKGARPLAKRDGWCDDREHRRYNRKVSLPFAASHEELWRHDEAYDLIFTTSHNQKPRVRGLGSAIFLHVWREGAEGTEGCIALKEPDLRKLLRMCRRKIYLVI